MTLYARKTSKFGFAAGSLVVLRDAWPMYLKVEVFPAFSESCIEVVADEVMIVLETRPCRFKMTGRAAKRECRVLSSRGVGWIFEDFLKTARRRRPVPAP